MAQKKGKIEGKKGNKKNIKAKVQENIINVETEVVKIENEALEPIDEKVNNAVEENNELETKEVEETIGVVDIKEIHDEALANTFKENNFSRKELGNMFGYSWNGQEIDF